MGSGMGSGSMSSGMGGGMGSGGMGGGMSGGYGGGSNMLSNNQRGAVAMSLNPFTNLPYTPRYYELYRWVQS